MAVPASSESPWAAWGIAQRQQASLYGDGVVHGCPLANAPIVDIAAKVAGGYRIHKVGFLGGQTNHPKVGPNGEP